MRIITAGLFLTFWPVLVYSVGSLTDYKYCVDRCFDQGSGGPVTVVQQGPPGKKGPIGPIGPKGEQGVQGPVGVCGCDYGPVFQDLRQQIERLDQLIPIDSKIKQCSLGLKVGGSIPSDAFSQSRQYNANGRGDAHHGRLDTKSGSRSYGSWIPHKLKNGEWIQVDLQTFKEIHSIVTQGRNAVKQWVTEYKVQYGPTAEDLQYVLDENGEERLFQGNVDSDGYQLQKFTTPLSARFVQIYPITWNGYPSFRFELLSC